MGTLWQRDRNTVWALNSLSRHRGQRGPAPIGTVWKAAGRTITVAKPNLPYGVGTTGGGPRRVTHLADRIAIAWMGGVMLGAQARWLCGHLTESFELRAEPDRPMCKICLYRADRAPTILMQINIHTVHIGGMSA